MTIRFIFFVACLILFSLIEKRPPKFFHRLGLHVSLIVIGSVLSAAIPFNYFYSQGLLAYLTLPEAFKTVIAMVVLDFLLYWQHRAFHVMPWLWRLHAVHHSDRAMDVTTGFRFHPIEILLSTVIKGAFIWCMGISPFAFLLFQVWLSTGALFTHAAIRLPQAVANGLELVIVTPNMHIIHHLTDETMQQKNFGFGLSLWDRIFKSFERSERAPINPEYGLASQSGADSLTHLLLLPKKI